MMNRLVSLPLWTLGTLALVSVVDQATASTVEYGADVSYPMQHDASVMIRTVGGIDGECSAASSVADDGDSAGSCADNSTSGTTSTTPMVDLGDRKGFYDGLIEGCSNKFGEETCHQHEKDRLLQGLRQPSAMINYTQTGFTKIRAPDKVFELIKQFWDINRQHNKTEFWYAGNTYVNHWDVDMKMVNIEDDNLEGGGTDLQQQIWNAARETIQEWTGQQLVECSLYGIRVYQEGSILAPHVDRLPLVSSAIINVDQDVDEPWPLEVIGHDGIAHNVTMLPGDLVLYESHSIIHGRPFALKGNFMANVFIHFEPVGPINGPESKRGGIPPYMKSDSDWEEVWRMENSHGWYVLNEWDAMKESSTLAHMAVRDGDLEELQRQLERDGSQLYRTNANGWTLLHEAVRSSDYSSDIVEYLLKEGVPMNEQEHGGFGASALHIAHELWGPDHESVKLLEKYNAEDIPPGDDFDPDEFWTTEIHQAARQGDAEALEELLSDWSKNGNGEVDDTDSARSKRQQQKRKAFVNAPDANGWFPLHEAVRVAGRKDFVQFLLNQGADMDARYGGSGGSVLFLAMDDVNDTEVIELLQSKGAQVIKPADD